MYTRMHPPLGVCHGVRAYGLPAIMTALYTLLSKCQGVTLEETGPQLVATVAAPHQLTQSLLMRHLLQYLTATGRKMRYEARTEAINQIGRHTFIWVKFPIPQFFSLLRKYDLKLDHRGASLNLSPLPDELRALVLGEIYGCVKPAEAPDVFWGPVGAETCVVGFASERAGTGTDAFRSPVQWCGDSHESIQLTHHLGGAVTDPQRAVRIMLRLMARTGKATVSPDEHQLLVQRPFHLQGYSSAFDYGAERIVRLNYTRDMLINRYVFAHANGGDLRIDLQALHEFAGRQLTRFDIPPAWAQVEILANLYTSAPHPENAFRVWIHTDPWRLAIWYPAPSRPTEHDLEQILTDWSDLTEGAQLWAMHAAPAPQSPTR